MWAVGARLTAVGTPPRVTVEAAPDDALEQVRLRPRHHEVVRLANILEPRALQFLERAFELQVLGRLVVFIPQSRRSNLIKKSLPKVILECVQPVEKNEQ